MKALIITDNANKRRIAVTNTLTGKQRFVDLPWVTALLKHCTKGVTLGELQKQQCKR